MKVMVTSDIATNLDRGDDVQTNTAARLVLTAAGVSLVSKELIQTFFGCGDTVRSVRILNYPSYRLHPLPPNCALPASERGTGFQPKLSRLNEDRGISPVAVPWYLFSIRWAVLVTAPVLDF